MLNNVNELYEAKRFRGEIYQADCDFDNEGKPYKPLVVIIQNNKGNTFCKNVIVAILCPMKAEYKNYPIVKLFGSKFVINYKDIQTLDKTRLTSLKPLDKLDRKTQDELDKKLVEFLLNDNDVYSKGDIRWVHYDGHFRDYEVQKGNRPGLILGYNEMTNEYIIAVITTAKNKADIPTHCKLDNGNMAFLEHIRTVKLDHVGLKTIHRLGRDERKDLEKCIKVSLAI